MHRVGRPRESSPDGELLCGCRSNTRGPNRGLCWVLDVSSARNLGPSTVDTLSRREEVTLINDYCTANTQGPFAAKCLTYNLWDVPFGVIWVTYPLYRLRTYSIWWTWTLFRDRGGDEVGRRGYLPTHSGWTDTGEELAWSSGGAG